MTVSHFPKNIHTETRTLILTMEDIILSINNMAKDLGNFEAFCFQMGKTSMAAQNVANAMRDLVRETEALEKLSTTKT